MHARTVALWAAVVLAAVACIPAQPSGTPEPTMAAAPGPTTPALSATPSAAPTPACAAVPCRLRPRTVGAFGPRLAPEASGLAASRRTPGLLYLVDDGPATTSLVVVRAKTGRALGRMPVAGLDGTDTEDLAVGPCDASGDRSCIYIADIGDNLAARDSVTITRVEEPDLSAGVPASPVSAAQVRLTYPDGPTDAEALLVDRDGRLLIVSKAPGTRGRGAARLYQARDFRDQQMRALGRVRIPQPALPLAAAVVGNVVTGGDAAAGRVVLRTYDAIFEFTAPDPGAQLRRFPNWPVREVASPAEPQGEAVAYGPDGCSLFTVSEDSPDLSVIACRP